MNNVLGIIGAGVLGQHIAHYAILSKEFARIVFFDDTFEKGAITNHGIVVGSLNDVRQQIESNLIQNLVIGIGYNHLERRESIFNEYQSLINFPNLIHNTCYIDCTVLLGHGNIFLPGCIIDMGSVVGNNNFFNPGVILAHDNSLGNHNFFAPGVRFSGFVKTGSKCFLGTGTVAVDNIEITDDVKTGAGSLINKNLNVAGLYYGVPAKIFSGHNDVK